ncbi:hypothetical protein GLOIN_2v1786104 [Rhizophagus clarus]|uniref:Uncharacterized protein n=1 Tax=Rhizophagus clarus TaxID=94130 RepID=A0A8H3QVT6_9GLOM|nr:hypothetical protein GLOIN_2v1786104 [Rhizophagus clarus]
MDLYISREYGSRYPALRDLGIGATNASKKVMRKGMGTVNFVVVDKPEYDLVLGNNWLVGLGYRIDKRDARYWENNEEKSLLLCEK